MRFFIISDLHIDDNFDMAYAKRVLEDLCTKIRTEIPTQEQILFISLGDIIHAGNIKGFDSARDCLNFIRDQLLGYSVNFDFVPGNHDAPTRNICPFDQFISEFGVAHQFETSGAYSKVYDGVNFIFADSVRHRTHNLPGELDIDTIKANVKREMQNILFCHHAFAQSHGGSHDAVEDSASVLKKLDEISINYVFHGHTHRSDEGQKNGKIIEIGCGSLFSTDPWLAKEDIRNQFTVGNIRDGKTIEVGRYVLSRDGSDIFPYSVLYPKQKTFVDPNTVGKIKYGAVPYIPRKIYAHSYSLKDSFSQVLSAERGYSLYEILVKEHNILLLSDAGMGKSIELSNLAHSLYDSPFFPFLYNLRNYTGSKIEDLLPVSYRELAPHRKALLFDGYDELQEQLRRTFEAMLNSYVSENPQVYVVLSSRRNFCRVNENDQAPIFPAFKAYDLWKLSTPDVEGFLEKEDINKSEFISKVAIKNYRDLLFNPFYLIELVKLYKKYGRLPEKTELMHGLIVERFTFDDVKFSGELEERNFELWTLLRKLAFSMQLLHQSALDDHSEYQLLFEELEDRILLKHCGLLQKTGDSWSFTHNNFREYLAAEFLSNLPEAQVKSYIATKSGIKASWLNTLGFLTGLALDWDLIGWLAEFCPEALVKCESDRLQPELRNKVFTKIILNQEAEYLWFDDEYCTEAELAHFSDSFEALIFLLDRIKNPVHERALYIALNVLRHFSPGLYGKRKEVRECLLSCCEQFPKIDGHICRLAIIELLN